MGQYKGTAFAARDWALAKRDLIEDLMQGWDSYAAMAEGASPIDRGIAREALQGLALEWDGERLSPEALEAFADEYDRALRLAAREHA